MEREWGGGMKVIMQCYSIYGSTYMGQSRKRTKLLTAKRNVVISMQIVCTGPPPIPFKDFKYIHIDKNFQ